MAHPLEHLVDAGIRAAAVAAAADSAFDNLPGQGKPLPDQDNPDNAVLNRLMCEKGAVPVCVSLPRDPVTSRVKLADTNGPAQRADIPKEILLMDAKIAIAHRAFTR